MCYLLVMAACHASSVSYGRKSMRYPVVMDVSKGITWKFWTRVNALHALVVMDTSCYGRKSVRYLVLWMKDDVFPVGYGRKSKHHLVVTDASQCVTW